MAQTSSVSALQTKAILTGFMKRCNTRLKIDDMVRRERRERRECRGLCLASEDNQGRSSELPYKATQSGLV